MCILNIYDFFAVSDTNGSALDNACEENRRDTQSTPSFTCLAFSIVSHRDGLSGLTCLRVEHTLISVGLAVTAADRIEDGMAGFIAKALRTVFLIQDA